MTLPAGEPELTLGYEAVFWAAKYLRHPNGPYAGQPWTPIQSQLDFMLWWYAIDWDGRWLFDHGVRRLSKGAGKSPQAGAMCLIELCAPVRFKGFCERDPADPRTWGGVRGKPVDMPLVQIAATSESQTANTNRMVRAFMPKGSRVVREHHLDPGKTITYKTDNGGQLEIITSSASAAEGALTTFGVLDEALTLGTMIPTPSGWTTVGEIKAGDKVFGTNGPVTVLGVTPVQIGRPCYRVTFQDGTFLVADEGHLWSTKIAANAALPKVRTTRQMAEDPRTFRRFMVPKMKAFDGPELPLPLDPYVLGAWLGDGASRWAGMTVGDEDLDFMLAEVRRRGVPAARVVKSGANRANTISLQGNVSGDRYTKDGSSLRGALVKLGLLENKHVPPALLRASLRQRLDLLRGLMDTDGYVEARSGIAVLVSGRKQLAEDVVQLARSLGYIVSLTSRADERWAKKPVIYKVTFRPDTDLNPFLMPRKAGKVREPSKRLWKSIRSIEPVESQPVQCIEVDASDHLFAAGDGWTVTHNTEHWKPANGGPDLAAVMDRNLAKSSSRAIETCNAWEPGAGSVAEATWDAWVAQEEGRTRSRSKILYDARVAPATTDLTDNDSLRTGIAAAYGDCFWVDQQTIMDRILSLRTAPDVARRFYLNQPVATLSSWVTPQEWSAISDPSVHIADGDEIVAFFDGSKSNDATALIGCHVETGHVFALGVWEPSPARDGAPAEQVPVGEVDEAVERMFLNWDVKAFFADVREWESFTKVEWPKRHGDDLAMHAVPGGKDPQAIAWDMRTRTYDFTMACEMTLGEILEGGFSHDGDSRVARHMINARRHPNRWGVSIGKETRQSPKKIDAAVCVIGARMVRRLYLAQAASAPPEKKKAGRVWGFA